MGRNAKSSIRLYFNRREELAARLAADSLGIPFQKFCKGAILEMIQVTQDALRQVQERNNATADAEGAVASNQGEATEEGQADNGEQTSDTPSEEQLSDEGG